MKAYAKMTAIVVIALMIVLCTSVLAMSDQSESANVQVGTTTDDQGVKYQLYSDEDTGTRTATVTGYDSAKNPTSITIPVSIEYNGELYEVTEIGGGAFNGYETLTEVSFAVAESGSYPLTKINNSAFRGTSISSIDIPDNVSLIGMYAFQDCKNLVSVDFPKSIGSCPFKGFVGCESLSTITMGGETTNTSSGGKVIVDGNCVYEKSGDKITLKLMAPHDATELVLREGTTAIDSNALNGSHITSVTLPASFTISAGSNSLKNAFDDFELTSITVAEGNETGYSIDAGVVTSDHILAYVPMGKTEITLPEEITGVGSFAVRDHVNLTKVTFEGSDTELGNNAFYGCTALRAVVLPTNISVISNNAFYGCTSLSEIKNTENVTEVQQNAFTNCSSLTSLRFAEDVKIGINPFGGCSSLEYVYHGNEAYVVTQEGDVGPASVSMGDGTYASIADAIADAPDGVQVTVTLTKDIVVESGDGITVPENKDVIIDSTGHTIKTNGSFQGFLFTNNGKLTLTGTGKIDSNYSEPLLSV